MRAAKASAADQNRAETYDELEQPIASPPPIQPPPEPQWVEPVAPKGLSIDAAAYSENSDFDERAAFIAFFHACTSRSFGSELTSAADRG